MVTERHGRFYLRIPELNLISEGRDFAAAYAELDAARRTLVDRHAAIGAAMPPPRDIAVRRALADRIMPFMLKAAAVAVVGSTLVIACAVAAN